MIEVSTAIVAKALGMPEDSSTEQVIEAINNGPPPPRFLPENSTAVAANAQSAETTTAGRFLPELR